MDQTLKLPVKVYYCQCGKSIQCAAKPDLLIGNDSDARALRKEFKEAEKWGRKVETITKEEFLKIPFMCDGVVDCPRSHKDRDDERSVATVPQ